MSNPKKAEPMTPIEVLRFEVVHLRCLLNKAKDPKLSAQALEDAQAILTRIEKMLPGGAP